MTDQTSTIPKGWKKTTLGNLINIKHGFAFSGEGITDVPTNNIILTPGNFLIGGGWKDGKKYFNGNIPKEYVLSDGDLIVTMTDLSKDADTLGYPALIPNDPTKKFLHNQRVGLVTINEKIASKKYIYFLLRFSEYQRYVVNTATGSTVRHTSPTRIQSFEFSKPMLPEQKSIAAVLSSLDDKIELLREQNKTLETIAQTIFKEWFVNFNFPGASGKMVESELGKIPERWRIGKLKDIVDIVSSRRIFADEYVKYGIPFYRSKEIIEKASGNRVTTELFISEEKFNEILSRHGAPIEGDVILTSVGTLGITYMVNKTDLFYFKDGNLTWFKNYSNNCKFYIYYWLKSKIGIEALKNITIGSTQKALTIDGLKGIKLLIPNNTDLEKFELIIKSIFTKHYNNHSQIQTLSKLRDALLPKLMKGEIRVKEFKN